MAKYLHKLDGSMTPVKDRIQINNLDELYQAASQRQSVCDAEGENRTSASFAYSMQAHTVHGLIKKGLFIYEPKGKRDKEPWDGKPKKGAKRHG